MKDSNYIPIVQSITNNVAATNMSVEGVANLTATTMQFTIYNEILNKRWVIEGYGNSTVVKSHGANPSY